MGKITRNDGVGNVVVVVDDECVVYVVCVCWWWCVEEGLSMVGRR